MGWLSSLGVRLGERVGVVGFGWSRGVLVIFWGWRRLGFWVNERRRFG